MAWDDNGKRIFAIGQPYRARGRDTAYRKRELTVRAGMTIRNALKFLPYSLLEGRSSGMERQVKGPPLSSEVLRQLTFRLTEDRMTRVFPHLI
jgi:hypothetical protein